MEGGRGVLANATRVRLPGIAAILENQERKYLFSLFSADLRVFPREFWSDGRFLTSPEWIPEVPLPPGARVRRTLNFRRDDVKVAIESFKPSDEAIREGSFLPAKRDIAIGTGRIALSCAYE